ncbi:hypothetical protein Lal_00031367 [Lupinus albus]|nr:hypothetical protein Lal_00031367 [Lupinus albus]
MVQFRNQIFAVTYVVIDYYYRVMLSYDKPDTWEWKFDKTKQYSVKSAYNKLIPLVQQSTSSPFPNHFLWKSKAPLKNPFEEALFKRDVLLSNGNGTLCSFCNAYHESSEHLFSSCDISYSVWQHIFKWLDIPIVLPLQPSNHYLCHSGMVKNGKHRKA